MPGDFAVCSLAGALRPKVVLVTPVKIDAPGSYVMKRCVRLIRFCCGFPVVTRTIHIAS